MSARVSRTVVLAVVSSLLVTVVAVATGSAGRPVVSMWQQSVDLAATALPSPAHSQVRDSAVQVRRSHARAVQADANATGSAGCDGCSAEGEALQVLYLNRPHAAVLDNVATAWSAECDDCRSSALSVQVVVLRNGTGVRANNRALAANLACSRCSTQAAAYQLVVLTSGTDRLDGKQMARLRAWVGVQRRALRQGTVDAAARSSARPQPPAADTSRIEDLVVGALGGTALVADVDLSGGPAG
jgi:hypothetical protein